MLPLSSSIPAAATLATPHTLPAVVAVASSITPTAAAAAAAAAAWLPAGGWSGLLGLLVACRLFMDAQHPV